MHWQLPTSAWAIALSATLLSGCFYTETEVITANDSTPALSEDFQTDDTRFTWNSQLRAYLGRDATGESLELRLARLDRDYHVLQLKVEAGELGTRYALGIVWAPTLSEARLMECGEKLAVVAWAYGVDLETRDNESFSMNGERDAILGFLTSILRMDLCEPRPNSDLEGDELEFTPSDQDLASQASPVLPLERRGEPPSPCTICPTVSGGCIQGSLVGARGVPLAHTSFTLAKTTDAGSTLEHQTDEEGAFFVTGLSPGPYELLIQLEGFRSTTLWFEVNADETAYFSPFDISTPFHLGDEVRYRGKPTRCPSVFP